MENILVIGANTRPIVCSLKNIGYKNISYIISKSYLDSHENWIYFKAKK